MCEYVVLSSTGAYLMTFVMSCLMTCVMFLLMAFAMFAPRARCISVSLIIGNDIVVGVKIPFK